MSANGRGIFDGEAPVSTTTIFDDSIFDTLLSIPTATEPITVLFHGMDTIPTLYHNMETIIVR